MMACCGRAEWLAALANAFLSLSLSLSLQLHIRLGLIPSICSFSSPLSPSPCYWSQTSTGNSKEGERLIGRMPLERYKIRNECGLGHPKLYDEADLKEPKAVLSGLSVAGLVGILRQLGDLAEFAAEVFHGLQEQVTATASRSQDLTRRARRIEATLPPLEKAVLSQTSHLHFAYTAGHDWHTRVENVQNHFIYNDLPRFIMDSYEICRDPPRFHVLDKFHTGGPGSCLRRYSDPTFFRRVSGGLISQNDEKVCKAKKDSKHRKKGASQRIKGILLSGATFNHDCGGQISSKKIETLDSQTASMNGSPLKSHTPENSDSFHSRSASDYIEHGCCPDPLTELEEKLSKESSSGFTQHSDTINSGLSNDQSSNTEADSTLCLFDRQDNPQSLNENGAAVDSEYHKFAMDKLQVCEINCDQETLEIKCSNLKNSDGSQILSADIYAFQEMPRKCKPNECDEGPDFGNGSEIMIEREWEQVTKSVLETDPETDSEQENYEDALNTIQSESETDLDYEIQEVPQISGHLYEDRSNYSNNDDSDYGMSEEFYSSTLKYGSSGEDHDCKIDIVRSDICSGKVLGNGQEEACAVDNSEDGMEDTLLASRKLEDLFCSNTDIGSHSINIVETDNVYNNNDVKNSVEKPYSCNFENERVEGSYPGNNDEDRLEKDRFALVEDGTAEEFGTINEPRQEKGFPSYVSYSEEDAHSDHINDDRLRQVCSRSDSNDRQAESYYSDMDGYRPKTVNLSNAEEDRLEEISFSSSGYNGMKETYCSEKVDYTLKICYNNFDNRVEEFCSISANDRVEDTHSIIIESDGLSKFYPEDEEENRSANLCSRNFNNNKSAELWFSVDGEDRKEIGYPIYNNEERLRETCSRNVQEVEKCNMHSSSAEDTRKEFCFGFGSYESNNAEDCYMIIDDNDRFEVTGSITDEDRLQKVCNINLEEDMIAEISTGDANNCRLGDEFSGNNNNDGSEKYSGNIDEGQLMKICSCTIEDIEPKVCSSDTESSKSKEGTSYDIVKLEHVAVDLEDSVPGVLSVDESHATSGSVTNQAISSTAEVSMLRSDCDDPSSPISRSTDSSHLSEMGLHVNNGHLNKCIVESSDHCPSKLNHSRELVDLQKKTDEGILSGICDSLESRVEISSVPQVSIWTNGGLLGLEPSKPPVFDVPSSLEGDVSVGLTKNLEIPGENASGFRKGQCLGNQRLPDALVSAVAPQGVSGPQCGYAPDESNGNTLKYTDICSGNYENRRMTSHQLSDQTRYGAFSMSHSFLLNSFCGSMPRACSDAKYIPASMKDEVMETRNDPYIPSISVSISEGLFKDDSIFDSPPASPPLEHMKISLNPLNCYGSSNLKLRIFDGPQAQETDRDVFFPSFQLIPEPVPLNSFLNDSDDDTFSISSLCRSDDNQSNQFGSNSDECKDSDAFGRRECITFCSSHMNQTSDSVWCCGLRGQITVNGIQLDGDDSMYTVDGAETPLSCAFLDLPSFDVVNRNEGIGVEDCLHLENDHEAQDCEEFFPSASSHNPTCDQVAEIPAKVAVGDKVLSSQKLMEQTFDLGIPVSAAAQDKPQVYVPQLKPLNSEASTSKHWKKMQLGMSEQHETKLCIGEEEMENEFSRENREKQSNQRRTVSAARPPPTAKANAILEKAYSIRQAVAGDNGEDDAA